MKPISKTFLTSRESTRSRKLASGTGRPILDGPALAVQSWLCLAPLILTLACGAADGQEPDRGLQRGQFEEEANHNFERAAEAYQSFVSHYDSQRKEMATAVFRLAECYRKLGKTNEAVACYQRLVTEFPDQTTLASLGRAQLGGGSTTRNPNSIAGTPARNPLLVAELASLKALDQGQLRQVLLTVSPDPVLVGLEQDLARAKQEEATVSVEYADDHPKRRQTAHLIKTLNLQIDERVQGILAGLEIEAKALRAQSEGSTSAHLDASVSGGTRMSIGALKEQRDLLQRELAVVQTQMESMTTRIRVGNAPPDDLVPLQRDALHLRGQLVAINDAIKLGEAGTESLEATAVPPVANASEAEEMANLQRIVQDSPDLINAVGRNEQTLLQTAAARGQTEIVRFLLDHGAEVNGPKQIGLTALHYAVGNGRMRVMEMLVKAGATIAATSSSGVTALHLAVLKGHRNIVQALLASGAPVNVRVTSRVDYSGDDLAYQFEAGFTPLHAAVAAGYKAITEALIEAKADVNARDAGKTTPLHLAASEGSSDLVELLLDHGAELDATNLDGSTPLALAVAAENLPAAKVLLSKGASANVRRPARPAPEMVELLRQHGAQDPVEKPAPAGTVPSPIASEFLKRYGLSPSSPPSTPNDSGKAGLGGERFEALGSMPQPQTNGTVGPVLPTDPSKIAAGGEVFFTGLVNAPVLKLEPGHTTTLMAALVKVGYKDLANLKRVQVSRLDPNSQTTVTKTVDVSGSIAPGDQTKDIVLEPGDHINVPEKKVIGF